MSQASRALVHAFETGALAPERAFFLRAELAPFRDIDAEQSFRPEYLRLKKAGWSVVTRIENGTYQLGQLLLTKHKEENFANIARAWSLLAHGGTLVCSGSNDDGAASLEKQVGKAFGLDGSANLASSPGIASTTVRRCSPGSCPMISWVVSPISAAAGATCRARF